MLKRLYSRILPILPPPVLKMLAARLVAKNALNYPIWGEGTVEENVDNAIKLYSERCALRESSEKSIKIDMVYSYLRYGATPLEYVLFNFMNKKHTQRKTFLTDKEKDMLSIQYTGFDKFKTDLQDKFHFYQLLSSYFKRGVLKLDRNTSFEQFEQFCRKEETCFIKPLSASYGIGAIKYTYLSETCHDLFVELTAQMDNGSYILEGFIEQDKSLSVFNASSVNTVRLPTIINGNGFHVLAPFLRTGRKGSIVDNGGGGGIFCAIDERTGLVVSQGCDEKGNRYAKHPDSGIPFKGFQIPEWNKLLALAEEIHKKMDGHKYIAWDFAYTPKGWVLIEGNWGQFLYQFALQIGIKKKFEKLMNH